MKHQTFDPFHAKPRTGYATTLKMVIKYTTLESSTITLEWIISTLKKSGVNSKKQVLERLENATIEELWELQRDITDLRREMFYKGNE